MGTGAENFKTRFRNWEKKYNLRVNIAFGVSLFVLLLIVLDIAFFGYFSVVGYNKKEFHFYQEGELIKTGDIHALISQCTNATGTIEKDKITSGKTVQVYHRCTTPLNPCEVNTCGEDGDCHPGLVSGAECSSSSQCSIIYNSSSFYCGSSCTCVNATTPAPPEPFFGYTTFTPTDVTCNNATVNSGLSFYQYRYSAPTIEIVAYIVHSAPMIVTGFCQIDITNLGILLSTTYPGTGGTAFEPDGYSGGSVVTNLYSTSSTVLVIDVITSDYTLFAGNHYLQFYYTNNATLA